MQRRGVGSEGGTWFRDEKYSAQEVPGSVSADHPEFGLGLQSCPRSLSVGMRECCDCVASSCCNWAASSPSVNGDAGHFKKINN